MRSRIVTAALLLAASVGCKDVYEGPRGDGGSGSDAGSIFDRCRTQGTLVLPGLGGRSSVSGDTRDGSDHLGAECGGGSRSPDHVWVLTAPASGQIVLEITSATFDTVLHVHTSCTGDALFCDDDGGSGQSSLLSMYVEAGATYYVVVDGFGNSSSGSYTLELENVSVAPSTGTDAGTARSLVEICADACGDCGYDSVLECVRESGCVGILESCDPAARSVVESCLAAGPACGLDCVTTSCGP